MGDKTSRFRKATIIVAMLCALLESACSPGLVKTLSDLKAIREHLIQKYHDEVSVNLTNNRLSVVFVNSPLNKTDDATRFERAHEAALFVSRNYEGIKSVEQIWMSFVASETHFIFFHMTQGLSAFGFDKDGAALPGFGGKDDPLAPVVKFNAAANQTDISLTRIQLQGNMNEGVALVPHFNVSGDARQGAAQAPEYVIFDFASYSRQPAFKKNAELEIACDDRLTVKGMAQLLPPSASGSDEAIAQFLTVRISFKSFLKMSAAEKVRITLGSKQFELKPEDISALAHMVANVSQG